MADEHSKLSGPPEILRETLDDTAHAVRVLPKAFTGAAFVDLAADQDGKLQVAVENAGGQPLDVATTGNVEVVTSGANILNVRHATATRTDVFTGAGNGTAFNLTSYGALYYSMQVHGVGAAANAWDVRLEISNDSTATWTEICAHATADLDGTLKFPTSMVERPALLMRSRCASVTLGSATGISVIIAGVG